jgi:hypothetical protein
MQLTVWRSVRFVLEIVDAGKPSGDVFFGATNGSSSSIRAIIKALNELGRCMQAPKKHADAFDAALAA